MTVPRRAWVVAVGAVLLVALGFVAGSLTFHANDPGPARDSAGNGPNAVDIGFAQDMTVHHQQAVYLSQLMQGTGKDPTLAGMAEQIILGQSKEIGILQGWLTLWHAPQLPSGPPMAWMHHGSQAMSGMPGMTTSVMPGMATQEELDRLAELHGDDRDRLFAELMIRHHEGGISMADDAAEHAATQEIQNFAATTSYEQRQEIGVLRAYLNR